MEHFEGSTADLDLVLGSLWLSRNELSRLRPGSVVLTSSLAGNGYELTLGGMRIADCETVIIRMEERATLCARIERLQSAVPPAGEPGRGTELTELLPGHVSLARATVELKLLDGLGRMSLIDLDADERGAATLVMAGVPVAIGCAVVLGERMGLRVTSLLADLSSDAPWRSSGNLVAEEALLAKVKDYDFSRPDCFTRRELDGFGRLHEEFFRSFLALSGLKPAVLPLAGIDQLNFTEFMDSLPEGELIIAAPASATVRPRLPQVDRPRKAFLRTGARGRCDEAAISAWVLNECGRPLGGAVLAAGAVLESHSEAVFTALRDAWKNCGALSPVPSAEFRRERENPARSLGEFAEEWEMVALASFDLGPLGYLNLAYPLRTIEGVLGALAL